MLPFLWCVITSSLPLKKSQSALTRSPGWPHPWWLIVHTEPGPGLSPWLGPATTSRSGLKAGGRARVLGRPQAWLDQEAGRETRTEVWPALKHYNDLAGLAGLGNTRQDCKIDDNISDVFCLFWRTKTCNWNIWETEISISPPLRSGPHPGGLKTEAVGETMLGKTRVCVAQIWIIAAWHHATISNIILIHCLPPSLSLPPLPPVPQSSSDKTSHRLDDN